MRGYVERGVGIGLRTMLQRCCGGGASSARVLVE
jgi:hypothetical protein